MSNEWTAVVALGGLIVGTCCALVIPKSWFVKWQRSEQIPWILPNGIGEPRVAIVQQSMDESVAPKEFPIAGKPRRVRWAVKRREIEAKHRTKRERMEEWN